MAFLDQIDSPQDLRKLPRKDLPQVATEVRERMIDVISKVGGHLAPGLGVVELTIALHYVLDTPGDRIVWDVGHQTYPHKILTGRNAALPTIRQKGGLSGFPSRAESEYDVFGTGHAATSISAVLGIANARDLNGQDFEVVGVIGDGSLTCGLAYEGLNNAGHTESDLIIILNDNEMSISPNVGAINKYLTRIVTNPLYNRVRREVKNLLHLAPGSLAETMEAFAGKFEDSVLNMFVPGMLFEELGFRYVGPVDGHDMDVLVDTLGKVRLMQGPRLLHVLTRKGKGFPVAEENPVAWHGATPFDKLSGEMTRKETDRPSYTSVFGKGLLDLGAVKPEMAVITAAMASGTGTSAFAEKYPERFFDVGIAESHGVTFAAALATEGVRPVVAVYSSFMQRAYDSVVHDVAIQCLPVVIAMDRAGLVGDDGATHMGVYDIAFLLSLPNLVVTAPKDGAELLGLLRLGLEQKNWPFTVRFPRDRVPASPPSILEVPDMELGSWELLREGDSIAILAVGTMVLPAMEAADMLAEEGINATVVNCRFLKPMDEALLSDVVARHDAVLTVEEGAVLNGFGSVVASRVSQLRQGVVRVDMLGIPDRFIQHATRQEQLEDLGLTPSGIFERAKLLLRLDKAVIQDGGP